MLPNWRINYFIAFEEQLRKIKDEVKKLKEKEPEIYKENKKTKLLARVYKTIFNDIAVDPAHPKFNLGSTLGKKHMCYKRAKSQLPARYRLFFRYKSQEMDVIILWMNDEFSLRKAGDKNDVYKIFLRMLISQQIPSKWKTLKQNSKTSN